MIRVQTTEGFAVEFPRLKDLERFIHNIGDYMDYLKSTCTEEEYAQEKAYHDCFVKAYEENK